MNEHEPLVVTSEETETLVANFHNVENLVPEDQELLAVPPEMRVSEALKLMSNNDYSQLPVVAGDAVLGVFSYRSFSSRAIARQMVSDEPLGELPVEDFLDDFEYVHSTEDWNRVLRYLNQDDGFFVGHREGLEGLVTTMDMLNYYREIASPLVMIAEIELSLRKIIETCIGREALPEAIDRCLGSIYPSGRIPTALNEMTFNDFVQIMSNRENWPYFESMFGVDQRTRRRTNGRLRQIGEWRNIVYHFRRRLDQLELETLADHREWLQRRVRAFEGRRRAEAAETESILPGSEKVKPEPDDFYQLLTRRRLPAGQRDLYKALYEAGESGLTREELVTVMGRRDLQDLGGVLGALGTRVNYTPGYGQTYKPGTDMVIEKHKTMDGEKLVMMPGLREALERLDPEWLRRVS
jgi:predicted transcriptional regulator